LRNCAGDVRAICAALKIDRLLTWGISGGGPHVLATAALLPDLVVAAASLASPAPYGAEGLDYYQGMGQLNVDDYKLYFRDKAAARAKVDTDREEMLAATPEEVTTLLQSLLSGPDAAVLTGDLAEYLEQSAVRACARCRRLVGGRERARRGVGLRSRGHIGAGPPAPR